MIDKHLDHGIEYFSQDPADALLQAGEPVVIASGKATPRYDEMTISVTVNGNPAALTVKNDNGRILLEVAGLEIETTENDLLDAVQLVKF